MICRIVFGNQTISPPTPPPTPTRPFHPTKPQSLSLWCQAFLHVGARKELPSPPPPLTQTRWFLQQPQMLKLRAFLLFSLENV